MHEILRIQSDKRIPFLKASFDGSQNQKDSQILFDSGLSISRPDKISLCSIVKHREFYLKFWYRIRKYVVTELYQNDKKINLNLPVVEIPAVNFIINSDNRNPRR